MPLLNNLSNMFEQLAKLPQRKITQVIILLLLSYIAYIFAQITWLVISPHSKASHAQVKGSYAAATSVSTKINVETIKVLNLFGDFYQQETTEVVEPVIENAPETRLKLTLTGVVASSDKKTAAAIVESSGKQETYSIGENIKGTRAVLENVFNDRVILKVSGKLETLMLDGIDFNEKNNPNNQSNNKVFSKNRLKNKPSPTKKVDQRGNKALITQAKFLKKALDSDPSKITDYLKISPSREKGKITGYKLMPAKDPTFFQKAGLRSGDIATQMNGFDLTQPREAAQALQSLKTAREISLLLDRNGDITEILFSIDD